MIFQTIFKQIKRNSSRSVLTIGVAVCLILFAGMYSNNIVKSKNTLKELAKTSRITGKITDISGKKQVGLEILPNQTKETACDRKGNGNRKKTMQSFHDRRYGSVRFGCSDFRKYTWNWYVGKTFTERK